MTTTFGCLDAASCGGPCSESGGGGGGGDGGGDGVGEWSGVIGLGEVWVSGGFSGWGGESNSEKIWLICRFMSSSFSSPPVGAAAGRLVWGVVGVIVAVRRVVTSASLSGFLSKVEVIVEKV